MKKIRRPGTEEPKLQFAVLPWRRAARLEIMLVSSRETGRWVLPKGWPMKGIKPHKTAAREALEEAGILGKVAKTSLSPRSALVLFGNDRSWRALVPPRASQ